MPGINLSRTDLANLVDSTTMNLLLSQKAEAISAVSIRKSACKRHVVISQDAAATLRTIQRSFVALVISCETLTPPSAFKIICTIGAGYFRWRPSTAACCQKPEKNSHVKKEVSKTCNHLHPTTFS